MKGTGKFLTEKEKTHMIQLYGMAQDTTLDPKIRSTNVLAFNQFCEVMKEKYNEPNIEINPTTGEIVCSTCDETLDEKDVTIE
jgi:hypothetical protein